MMKSRAIKILFLITALTCQSLLTEAQESKSSLLADSVALTKSTKKKKTFFQRIMKPFKWIGENWSAYDPRYSTPSFYNWVGQFQNTSSLEMLHLKSDDMMDVKVRSKWSHKIGPHLGYSFLFYGYTIDVNALKGTNRKSEFGLSINSNLVNIDLVRRRTGGDFMFNKLTFCDVDLLEDQAKNLSLDEIGENIYYDLTGFNLNYFTNHKKYSNPAAFSNGAIQLRSVGSPILGFGYFNQKLDNSLPTRLALMGIFNLVDADGNFLIPDDKTEEFMANVMGPNKSEYLREKIKEHRSALFLPDNYECLQLVLNCIPNKMTIHDYHLQLGYAYNLVFSRRLLLGMSLIASPGLKVLRLDNSHSPGIMTKNAIESATDMNEAEKQERLQLLNQITPDINTKATNFGVNFYARASLTYNYNRWRAGINANVNSALYHSNGITFNDGYGSACVYVGYCFGRKKEYRWNGKNREAYIKSALTNYQIEEMHDTTPVSNLDKGHTYEEKWGKTKYKTDEYHFDIRGCDLVKGPDGSYGSFQVKDGRVTHGNDTEERIRAGKVYQMDKNGTIEIEAGHHRGIRPANWLKSQLTVRQIPINWYPEMLHYCLRGTLSFYVRDHSFGTRKPVKVTIDNFYLSHSWDTKECIYIGAKQFYSHSAYSIVGTANVNNRLCRIYIESRKSGQRNYVYINTIKLSALSWMKYIPDDRPISKISIPGTHDAGSCSLPESSITSMAHTQNFTILEQLADGIRAFDIRLKKNMKFGHGIECRDGFDETLEDMKTFLTNYPSEFLVAMIGSDEGGKWDKTMQQNFKALIDKYPDLFVEKFDATTNIEDVRGKILVIKRQKSCPFGKHLKFEDNATFTYDCFCVEDEYKMHKTYKKSKLVEQHLREAYENEDPSKWYITFNSIAWDPRHHKPYYSAWGAINVRKPMNKALREILERKHYNDFGMVFLDFYNDHGDRPELVREIIKSNLHLESEDDYIPADKFELAE